jgi:fructose-specific component phosphotransferase system IIB-like protein
MSKFASDSVLDALLDKVATGTILTVCSTQPTNRTEAVTTYKLADVVIDSGDFAKADGAVNGRKLTVAQQDNVGVDNSGTAAHVAICDGTNLLYVTTVTSQVLTSGNTVTVPAWTITVSDPS